MRPAGDSAVADSGAFVVPVTGADRSAAGGQPPTHLLVHGLDRLERPHHHAELDDPAGVVAADDVDAVHVLALDARLELEHRGVPGDDLLGVLKGTSGPT